MNYELRIMDDKQQILQNLELPIKKLAALLYDSNMSEDVKEAWLALLPKMTLEQIDRLLAILEAKYLDEKTRHIDAEFKEKIKAIAEKLKEQDAKNEKVLLEQISHLR